LPNDCLGKGFERLFIFLKVRVIKMTTMHQKPKFVYIARESCGCCCGVCNDGQDNKTAEYVAGWINGGCSVNRVAWDDYKNEVSQEETFMKCPHGQKRLI